MKTRLLLLFVLCVSMLAFGASTVKPEKVKGYLTDAACASLGKRTCNDKSHLENGGKLVIAVDEDGSVLTIENPKGLEAHMGHHVSLLGEVNPAAKSIKVEKLSMLKQ